MNPLTWAGPRSVRKDIRERDRSGQHRRRPRRRSGLHRRLGRRTRPPARLTGMVLAELRQLAGELNIPDTARMRKGDLIAAIKRAAGGQARCAASLPIMPSTSANGDGPASERRCRGRAGARMPPRRHTSVAGAAHASLAVRRPGRRCPRAEPPKPPAAPRPRRHPPPARRPSPRPRTSRRPIPAEAPAADDGDPTPRRSRQRRGRGGDRGGPPRRRARTAAAVATTSRARDRLARGDAPRTAAGGDGGRDARPVPERPRAAHGPARQHP